MWNDIFAFIFSVQCTALILILIGAYALLWWSIDNFKSIVQIITSFLVPYFQPQEDLPLSEKFGTWAVITGSTDGIGREYAKQLANRGINIVLISRTKSKLIEVANEIESLYPVKTKYIVADFSNGKEIYDEIEQQLSGIPVGILVNNVGRMYDYPEELGKLSPELLWSLINVNMSSVTMMTRMLINDMKKRGKGAIVNISSGSELQPLPFAAVYGASKIYVKNFTLAIQHEFAPFGISVQLITPLYVRTKMNYYSTTVTNGNIFCPDVETYTRSAVASLGRTNETTGYWIHGLQYATFKLVPTWLRTIIGAKLNEKFRDEYFAQQQPQECK